MIEENVHASIRNREDLERRIIRGLSCEWEHALWALAPEDRKRMRHPLFRLDDLKGRHGTWSAARREITINRQLVLNHSWDAVREVLLHEIAHQFRDEILQAGAEPPHGPEFQRACRLLRADPKASGNYPTLDERILGEASDTRDQIMIRIKKLMALAESQNRYEAESAMAKAHELIAKYNVDLAAGRRDSEFDNQAVPPPQPESIFLGRPALRHTLDKYHLAHLLQDFYFVRGVWVTAYVLEREKMGRVLEISGSVENIQIAAYIYDCINEYIQTQWSAYCRGKKISLRRRTDFAVGVISGFRSKLDRSMKAVKGRDGTAALIKSENHRLDGYMHYRYPNLVGFKRGASSVDHEVRLDGERIGKELVIRRGITGREKSSRRLLPCTRS
jgi:hypothetical protein